MKRGFALAMVFAVAWPAQARGIRFNCLVTGARDQASCCCTGSTTTACGPAAAAKPDCGG